MKISINILCVFLIAVPLLFAGCNLIGQKTPSEIVELAYMAGNNGNYAETKKYFSSAFLNALGGNWRIIASDNKRAWDRMTKKGTIDKMKFIEEEILGKKAVVHFRLFFKDGSQKKLNEYLIKENGAWKINL